MPDVNVWGPLLLFAGAAYAAMWAARNGRLKWGQSVWVITCHIGAVLLAFAASALLARTWLGTSGLSMVAGIGPWIGFAFGVAALLLPVVALVALIPSWPLAISEVLVTGLLFLLPLQAYALPGAIPGLASGLTRVGSALSATVTGGAF